MSEPAPRSFSDVVAELARDPRASQVTFTADEASSFAERVLRLATDREMATPDEAREAADRVAARRSVALARLAEL